DKGRRQAHHLEPLREERPSAQTHPETPVTLKALHMTDLIPIVANLIDEPEPQPNRIREGELGYRTRQGRLVKNSVGGTCKKPRRKTLSQRTTGRIGITASSGRILRVEFSRKSSINFRRQLTLQDLHRPPRQKYIVAFLDPWRCQ